MHPIDQRTHEARCHAVDSQRDRVLDDLLQLLRVPSVTGDEGAVQDVIERLFYAPNLTVDRWQATAAENAAFLAHWGERDFRLVLKLEADA